MEKSKPKMVLIYAHKDGKWIENYFIHWLEALAAEENLDFWWDRKMKRTLWDEEIKRHLNEADIVICFVSQRFIVSEYIKKVEARNTFKRLMKEGLIVLAVMFEDSTWNQYEWLRRIHHLPTKGYIRPDYVGRQAQICREIIDHIRERIRAHRGEKSPHNGIAPYREPRALSVLRRQPDSIFSTEEKEILVKESKRRADQFVPDRNKQKAIIQKARALRKKNGGQPLNKEQLASLDKEFLQKHEGRENSDPKKVRWVLRAARLHPQGAYNK